MSRTATNVFYKFFIRYFIALTLALFVTVNLANIFQNRYVLDTLERGIKDDAALLARTVGLDSDIEMLTRNWGASHTVVRLLIFDTLQRPIADSQPQPGVADFATLNDAEFRKHHFVASSTMLDGRRILLIGSLPPPFAPTQIPGLIFLILLILGLVFLAVYPLTRSISETLLGLGRLAREAASGKFGSTLATTRSDELGSLIRAFNDMSRRLADGEQLNRRLLQDVSHELRSPLTRISALAETVEHRPERLNVCLPDIRREVALLDRLVGDLLDITRFESETPPLAISTFSLQEWSRDFLERLEQRAHIASVKCIAIPCDTPISIVADPQRVEQAVGNVFDNALTATKGRPDALIRLTVTLECAYWRICVIDNGPGVPAEDLPFLFRRFYRAQSHRSRASGGIGLGLAIAKAIVEAHAGTVEFDSHGDGVRVMLSFPLRSAV
jgi:signal transduction histidine kinase